MPLQIEARQERSITIIRVFGSIYNGDGASELKTWLARHAAEGQNNLLLDVDGVGGLDAAGVEALQTAQAEAKQAGGDLKIAGARYPFWAVMAYNDATPSFPYYANSDEALASFAEGPGGGVRHFDILEFVKEQEKEEAEQLKPTDGASVPRPE